MGTYSKNTGSTVAAPPDWLTAGLQDVTSTATGTAGTPYQPFTGGVNGSGFSQDQLDAYTNISNLTGAFNPYATAASSALQAGLVPTSQTYQQYWDPFYQQQQDALLANWSEASGQEQQQAIGDAIAKGAMGGNRVGVAQSELARQQQLAYEQASSGLLSTTYNNALAAAQSQQQADLAAASGYTNLGTSAMNAGLAQAAAQLGAGTQQQEFDYTQYLNELAYPYMQSSWLTSILGGAGSVAGGTSDQYETGNYLSDALGLATSIAGLFKNGGVVPGRAMGGPVRRGYDSGGVIPYSASTPTGYASLSFSGTPYTMGGLPYGSGAYPSMWSMVPAPGTFSSSIPTANDNASSASSNPFDSFTDEQNAGFKNIVDIFTHGGDSGWNSGSGYGDFAAGGVVRPRYAVGGGILPSMMMSPQRIPGATNATSYLSPNLTPGLAGMRNRMHPSMSQLAQGRRQSSNIIDLTRPNMALAHTVAGGVGPGNGNFAGGGVVTPFRARQGFADGGDPSYDDPFGAFNVLPVENYPPDLVATAVPQVVAAPAATGVASIGIGGNLGGVAPVTPQVMLATQQIPSQEKTMVLADTTGGGPPMVDTTVAVPPIDVSGGAAPDQAFGADQYGAIEQKYGLPAGYLGRTAMIESGGGKASGNVFQFMPGTARQYGVNPNDPASSADGAARLAADNTAILTKALGRAPNAAELYLAHQQGGYGAAALLTNPGAVASSLVGVDAVTGNGGNPGMTAGQFANQQMGRYNGAATSSYPSGGSDAYGVVPASYDASQYGNSAGVVPYSSGTQFTTDPTPGYSQNIGDAMKSLAAGKGLNLSPDVKQALLVAGANMMKHSPFFFENVGRGINAGVATWGARQNLERANAQARANIGQHGQEIATAAYNTAANIKSTTAAAGATRYTYTPTLGGVLETDSTTNTVKTIPYGQMTGSGEVSSQNLTKDQPRPKLFAQTAPHDNYVDPRSFSPQGQQIIVAESGRIMDQAADAYNQAQQAQQQITEIKHAMAALPPEKSFLAMGAGIDQREQFANSVNTLESMIGMPKTFNANELASVQDFQKVTTRLATALNDSFGTKAEGVVMAALAATPNAGLSPQGAEVIIKALGALNQRQIDRYYFLSDYQANHGGSLQYAEQKFQQTNAPEFYVLRGVYGLNDQAIMNYAQGRVPQAALNYLAADPKSITEFNQKYGSWISPV